MFAQFRVPPLTISLKQQQFTSIVIILYTFFTYNNNCSLEFYSRDLRTKKKIILFSHNVSSHKTDRILSQLRVVFTHDWLNSNWTTRVVLTHDWLCAALCCLLYPMISSLMNAHVGECFFLPSRILYKCKLIAAYCVFCLRSFLKNCCRYLSAIFVLNFVIVCLLICPFIFLYWRSCFIFVYSLVI